MPSVVANAGTPSTNNKNDNAAPKAKACFKCGQQGHLGKECTASKKSDGPVVDDKAAPKAKACFKCGQQGHLGKECTASKKSDGPVASAPAKSNSPQSKANNNNKTAQSPKTDGPAAADKTPEELEKEAEAKRIAAEKRAEQARIAAEKKAEAERIAAEKKAEEDRIAAEKKAAEEAALAELERLKKEIMEQKDVVVKRINTLSGAELDAEIQTIKKFASDPKDPKIRLACNEIWSGVIATMTPATEPATVKLIPEFLASTTDRDGKVRAVASDNMLTLCAKVCHHGVSYALPLVFPA